MPVQILNGTLSSLRAVVLHNGSIQASPEIVLFNQTLFHRTLCCEQFIEVFISKLWAQSHHLQSSELLILLLDFLLL